MSGYDLDENEWFNSGKEKLNSGRFQNLISKKYLNVYDNENMKFECKKSYKSYKMQGINKLWTYMEL
jgi:hypothetical protein